MLPDYEKYRPYFAEFDMTEAQKDEYILQLWKMMETVVDIAWGVDSTSLAKSARDKSTKKDSPKAREGVKSFEELIAESFVTKEARGEITTS